MRQTLIILLYKCIQKLIELHDLLNLTFIIQILRYFITCKTQKLQSRILFECLKYSGKLVQ